MRPSDFPELPAFLFLDQPWAEQALCAQVDPDTWYPSQGGDAATAKRVCASCNVRAECLDWAIATHERFGVWGGLSRDQRDAEQRARKAAA